MSASAIRKARAGELQGRRAGFVSRFLVDTIDFRGAVGGLAGDAPAGERREVRHGGIAVPPGERAAGTRRSRFLRDRGALPDLFLGDHRPDPGQAGARPARRGPGGQASAGLAGGGEGDPLSPLPAVGLLWVVVSRRNASVQDLVVRSAVAYNWAYRRGGRASAVRCRRWRLGRPGRLAQAAQPNWRLDTHVRILSNCPLVCADSVRDTNLGASAGAVDHTQSCRRHLGRRAAACTLCARLTRVNGRVNGTGDAPNEAERIDRVLYQVAVTGRGKSAKSETLGVEGLIVPWQIGRGACLRWR